MGDCACEPVSQLGLQPNRFSTLPPSILSISSRWQRTAALGWDAGCWEASRRGSSTPVVSPSCGRSHRGSMRRQPPHAKRAGLGGLYPPGGSYCHDRTYAVVRRRREWA